MTKVTVRAGLALALLVGAPAPVQAQQQQGDLEFRFSGSVFSTVGQEGGSFTAGIVQASGSYFVSDRVQVGAFPSLVFSRTEVELPGGEDVTSDTRLGLGLFGKYSFLAEDATTVPYVGAQLYRIDLTNENETGWAGLTGGVKLYLDRTTALDLGANVLAGIGQSDGTLVLFEFGLNFLL